MRTLIHFCLTAIVACGLVALAQTDGRGAITQLESEWNGAHVRGDATVLDKLMADDLIVVVPGMRVMSKADSLGVFSTGRMKFDRYETSETTIRVYEHSAIVTGRLHRARKMADRAVDDDWRFTKVYVQRGGRWQVVSFHASPVAP
jgi:ketosteroid isomerase-like protein